MANNFDRETRKQHWEYTARKPRHEAAAGSALIVHFSAPSENIDWATPAILRWCQANATGWECGCEFEEELPWEQLGQLLLGGYLSME
jgi:hypothetical protein